jgi:hypothetical protein
VLLLLALALLLGFSCSFATTQAGTPYRPASLLSLLLLALFRYQCCYMALQLTAHQLVLFGCCLLVVAPCSLEPHCVDRGGLFVRRSAYVWACLTL